MPPAEAAEGNVMTSIAFGPCCFCGKDIEKSDTDPCRVTVETQKQDGQVWFSHAKCFKERLVELPELPGFFDPAFF
jgi:hypothetical protein